MSSQSRLPTGSDSAGDVDDEASDYLAADAQLHPTVGPNVGTKVEGVTTPSTGTVEAVSSAIESPKKPTVDGWDDRGVPVGADGSTRWLPTMALPGFGEEQEDCGDDLPLFCEDCGHVSIVGRTCKQSMCPRCGAAWCRDRAISFCARLDATRRVRENERDRHQRFHHLVFCPPDDWMLEAADVLGRTFHVIRDILEALDVDGYVFYHPWAGDTADGEDDRGNWRDRQFSGREWADVRDELKFRPHFHVIAVGHSVPGGEFTTQLYDRTGWVYKRITKSEDSSVSIYDDEDLAAAVSYCLSHTAIDTSGENNYLQYRKYGSVVNNSTVFDDNRERIDKIVRRVAPKTLGVSLGSQLCVEKTIKPPTSDGPSAKALMIQRATGDDAPEFDEAGVGGPTSLASDSFDETVRGMAEAEQDVEEIEPTPCEGRMLHIKKAERFLDDDDWVRDAEHVDVLQTTWDEWADRLDELVGG